MKKFFRYCKEDWPLLIMYIALSFIITSAGITYEKWQLWVLWPLIIAIATWNYHQGLNVGLERFRLCMKQTEKHYFEDFDRLQKHMMDIGIVGITPPSSAPPAPANTSQRDATPPPP